MKTNLLGRLLLLKVVLLIHLVTTVAYGLIPLDSLILGDLSASAMSNEAIDSVRSIFNKREMISRKDFDDFIYRYRGFISEAHNLQNSCELKRDIRYSTPWQREQVKRSILSSLQYIGLDVAVNAIPLYAKHFEFSKEEYVNLVDRLVDGYCSKNLTIIGLGQLRNNLIKKFEMESSKFSLPDVSKNQYFSENLEQVNVIEDAKKQEFLQTVKIFRGMCSWGGDVNNSRLLVPFLNNPVIMSYLFRQMTGKVIGWMDSGRVLYRKNSSVTTGVSCKNIVCRRVEIEDLKNSLFRSVGHKSFEDDFNRLYCQDLKEEDFRHNGQSKKVLSWMKKMTLDDYGLQVGQLVALITGVPDFFVRSNLFSSAKEYLRASFDNAWDEWAEKESDVFKKDILFEESMRIEKVNRKLFFNEYIPKFKAAFDVNFGEFDRVNQKVGKISVVFNIKIEKDFLREIRNDWIRVGAKDEVKKQAIFASFGHHIQKDINEGRKSFSIPPWKKGLKKLIVQELLIQLESYKGDYFVRKMGGFINIPVELNFGPFALKYINYLKKLKKNGVEI